MYLSAGYTGLIQTHVLTTMLTVTFSILFCLLTFRNIRRLDRLKAVFGAAGITVLLNAGFIVPFADYYL